jgi:hypothetical protein
MKEVIENEFSGNYFTVAGILGKPGLYNSTTI